MYPAHLAIPLVQQNHMEVCSVESGSTIYVVPVSAGVQAGDLILVADARNSDLSYWETVKGVNSATKRLERRVSLGSVIGKRVGDSTILLFDNEWREIQGALEVNRAIGVITSFTLKSFPNQLIAGFYHAQTKIK